MILRTRLVCEQRGEAGVAVAGVVVDDGEVARALRDQRVDELGRHAGRAEAADHDGGAVVDVGDGGGSALGTILLITMPAILLYSVGERQADVVFGEARRRRAIDVVT